jgi:hypothetical protein
VLGPFPNLRNTLTGTFKSEGPDALTIQYTALVDGTGKEVTSGNAATVSFIALTYRICCMCSLV